MIFVTVGSSKFPFDRLLAAVGELAGDFELVVQAGPSTVPLAGAERLDFMPFDALVAQIERADVVVTHAGVGSIMAALTSRKRPIVVPRRRRYGETVDDHQVVFARRLAEVGLVTLIEDPREVRDALGRAALEATLPSDGELVRELSAYVAAELVSPSGTAR